MEGLSSARIPRDTVVHISSLTGLAEKRVKKKNTQETKYQPL